MFLFRTNKTSLNEEIKEMFDEIIFNCIGRLRMNSKGEEDVNKM